MTVFACLGMAFDGDEEEVSDAPDGEDLGDERVAEMEALREENAELVERLDKSRSRERVLYERVKKAEAIAGKREQDFKQIEEQFNWANILRKKKQRENDALMMEKQHLESKIKMAQTLQARAEKLLLEEQKEVQR